MKFGSRWIAGCAAAIMALSIIGCSSAGENPDLNATTPEWESIPEDAQIAKTEEDKVDEAATEATTEEEASKELPEGTYRSELTGLPISTSLQNQRPIAMMIDNDERAMPHYGAVDCDVVYEMLNSTDNNRITRLMCVLKDWGSITQLGSIRSTRPTNIFLAPEWNAVLCHDGGPFYNDQYWATNWAPPHFSGYFSRVNNGKATEFTEYCLQGEMAGRFSAAGVSTSYTAYPGDHFQFAEYGEEVDLSKESGAITASKAVLNFPHTNSRLIYNSSTKTYDYYEYGAPSKDGITGATMSYKNVFLQSCSFNVYDEHGYLKYDIVNNGQPGYYLTDGYAIPITWTKSSETAITRYYDASGQQITVNSGKSYIGICPNDTWGSVTIQ